jgi:hypothetical protein
VRAVKTFSKSGFAVTALLLTVVACANSADVAPVQEAQPTDPAPAAKIPPASPTKACAPSCATDADCQNSCPALAGGVQCCDTKAKTCFGSKTAACPTTTTPADAGTPDPAPAY